ncbi:MAG: ABC transporter substrate-binding protein [Clostridium sp.]|nr:ABC transporter substrate-binding protein [Clostridium sp.]
MRKHIRIISFFMTAAMLTGCSGNTDSSSNSVKDAGISADTAAVNESETNEEAAGTHIVIDHTGTEVEVTNDVTRVVIDQIPILSTYTAYFEGNAPYLVGFCGAFKDTISKTVLKDIAPELLETADTVYAQSDLNIEEIMKLEPDVILYNAANDAHKEIFEQSGIPAVGFATSSSDAAGTPDPVERYEEWLQLLEDVFNEDGKTDDFIAAGDAIISDVESRISSIPDDERPSAVIITNYADGTPSVAGGNFFGSYWLERLGAKNPAADAGLMALAQVNVEQIYEFNPDILYLGGLGLFPYNTDEVVNNKIDNLDLTSLDAVKNGKVYDSTLGMWNWFTPNPDVPLVYAWMACKAYPEQFADYPLEDTIRSYYKQWYGYDVTDSDMAEMLYY